MKIKGIVFDKDGTLLDYERCWYPVTLAAIEQVAAKYPGAEVCREGIKSRLGLLPDGSMDIDGPHCRGLHPEIAMAFLDEYEAAGIEYDRDTLIADVGEGFRTSLPYGEVVPICDGMRELLESLKKQGIKLGLITSDTIYGARHTLSKLGIADAFEVLLTNDGEHPAKPDPYYMTVFERETGLSPDEILMVGDTFSDIDFGINAGTHTLGVAKTEKNRRKLETKAEFVSYDITDIFNVLGKIEGN